MPTRELEKQTRFGGPDSANPGDCFSAVVAAILAIPLSEVPLFVEEGDAWFPAFQRWANEQGYAAMSFDWADWINDWLAGCLVEAGGSSPRGDWDHSILWRVGEGMVWDPHPSDAGLVGHPKTVTILVPKEIVPLEVA